MQLALEDKDEDVDGESEPEVMKRPSSAQKRKRPRSAVPYGDECYDDDFCPGDKEGDEEGDKENTTSVKMAVGPKVKKRPAANTASGKYKKT